LKTIRYLLSISAIFSFTEVFSQQDLPADLTHKVEKSNLELSAIDSARQKDLIDIFQKIIDKKASPDKRKQPRKANFSVVPYSGYTLSSGFTANITGNVGFFTSKAHDENYSVIAADIGYDSKNQRTFFSRSEIWTSGNKYKLVSDLRFERYPTDTYGLGTFTTFAADDKVNFNYLRVYETVLRKIVNDYYAGIGYNLDYHYNISATANQDNTVSDFMKYGQTNQSTSAGFNVDFLFDNRKNPLNPKNGTYANVIYRQNLGFFGSDANWQEIQVDVRKYFLLKPHSNNVLAFWGIAAFTSGSVPYFDLPATGLDMYNNMGRGYALGRFRGKNLLYLESEYRFGITKNGLLGGVLFANGQSFSEIQTKAFARVAPAAGTGIRIKFNKHSDSNIGIDYGVGTGGSHGFFVNLGEVF
jgi:hypothetical protein